MACSLFSFLDSSTPMFDLDLKGVLFVQMFFTIIGVLISSGYLILTERKILGAAQRRKGPNKSRWKGALQPLADMIKLIRKEWVTPRRSNKGIFRLVPCLAIGVSFVR